MALSLVLPPRHDLTENPQVYPLHFYYHPLWGWMFRGRLNAGLRMLPAHVGKLLEIGYGSGLLLPTLRTICDELHGLDLEAPTPELQQYLGKGIAKDATLAQGSVTAPPYADATFDTVIAFSIFEHLREHELGPALVATHRILKPGGKLLVGCPAVHKLMNLGFRAIGFAGIENHHFSSLNDVIRHAPTGLVVVEKDTWPKHLPFGVAPYNLAIFERR